MMDRSLLLPHGRLGDAAVSSTGGPPASREEVLARLSPVKRAIYGFVRGSVDELEQAAPWDLLYYPPEDPEALLAMIGSLVLALRDFPDRVEQLIRGLPRDSGGGAAAGIEIGPTGEDVGFLLHGIHRMVAHDLKRVESRLEQARDGAALPTPAERQHLCELAADLEGKYASSLMGAAASLVGEGIWTGVEVEPVLFPEKAEEFRCTRELVAGLRDVVAAIRRLPEQIPLSEVVERWRQGRRIDQYALADLPSLRGKIGRLLQKGSRRALYSGDYHQISRRELLLSARINELERLHQVTWSTPGAGTDPSLAPVFVRLVQLAQEIAAVLDVDLLKQILGEKKVNGLRGRAGSALAAGKSRAPEAGSAIDGPEALLPLLAEDDLRIFFEMLLTAVQRRASLAVREPAEPAAPAPAAPPAPPAPAPRPVPQAAPPAPPPQGISSAALPAPPPPAVPEPAPARRPKGDPRAALGRINAVLADLQASTNPHWSSFRMTQRLLAKHSRIPVAMFHAVNPFLQDILWRIVPDLKTIVPYKGLTDEAVGRLEAVCRELCEGDPDPAQFADEIPRRLERILRFLDGLRAIAQPDLTS
jgi:hypothetical protein